MTHLNSKLNIAPRTATIVRMLNVGCAMRKRHKAVPALADSLFAAAWSTFGGKGSGELVSFVLEEVVARETDSEAATVTPAMQVHCLREAAEAAADSRLAKSFKSADLPKILYALTSEVSPSLNLLPGFRVV